MLLEQAKSNLLVVDVQERLLPAMATPNEIMAPIQLLLRAAATLGVPVLASEQYPKGLGRTVPPIRDLISENQIVEKIEFSCAANPNLRRGLLDFGRDQVGRAGTPEFKELSALLK